MSLTFRLTACLDGKALDARLLSLLDALNTHGSLAAATRVVGVSYRFAWDRLRSAELQFGQPLVRMERGRGAHLTPIAVRLLNAHARAGKETAGVLARISRDFSMSSSRSSNSPTSKLMLAASHDLALIELKHFCAQHDPVLELDLQFRGSLDALLELSRGRCDLAGFHIGPDAHAAAAVGRVLSPRRHRLIVLGERVQGLMLAPDNPRRIRGIEDLCKRGVRFVNRQTGSGTRLLFDRLLAASGRSAEAIRGYSTEEFTHVAVAATVASGHADAGFGIEAAAARYGLAFQPLSRECYYLAARRTQIERAAVQRLIAHMRSPALRRRLARLRGYRIEACGTLSDVAAAIERSER